MAVRLNKALKELNVGINTVAEFLQKKGLALEDASPNAKITDEQYNLLMGAFGADKNIHDETKMDIKKRKEKEKQEREERREKEKEKQRQEIFRVSSEKKPQIKVLGKIDTRPVKDNGNDVDEKPAVQQANTPTEVTEASAEKSQAKEITEKPVENKNLEEKKSQQENKPAEEMRISAEKDGAAKNNNEEKTASAKSPEVDKDGIYRMPTPDAGVQFKQVGFIDLSNINSKTRPDRKRKQRLNTRSRCLRKCREKALMPIVRPARKRSA